MIGVLDLNAIVCVFQSVSVQTKDYEICIVASPLRMQHEDIRTKTDLSESR